MRFCFYIALFLMALSCQDDDRRAAATLKDQQKKESVFKEINRVWKFNTQPENPVAQEMMASWEQWRMLMAELSNKPQSSISAFRKKSSVLSQKIAELNTRIPAKFDKPEIHSRIAVLNTKTNALDLYLHLDDIPAKKVAEEIAGINAELSSIQRQMAEIVRKSQIPKEEGEMDMIRMLDTSRAIQVPKVAPSVPIAKPALAKPLLNEPK